MSILGTLRGVLTAGLRQARWGLRVDHYVVARRCRQGYHNTFIWYASTDPPDSDAPAVEIHAYRERQHWEAVMDELEVDYGPPEGSQ